ncbi:hypothetical protein MKX03_020626, partial [Papaver bracteatum]
LKDQLKNKFMMLVIKQVKSLWLTRKGSINSASQKSLLIMEPYTSIFMSDILHTLNRTLKM